MWFQQWKGEVRVEPRNLLRTIRSLSLHPCRPWIQRMEERKNLMPLSITDTSLKVQKTTLATVFSVFTCRIKFIVTIGRFLIFENKEKKLVFTNFYLFPLPIQKQAEILLKPGSRQEKNGHVVQSKEEPESNSAYPAKGPQRDFNTFATSVELVRTPR